MRRIFPKQSPAGTQATLRADLLPLSITGVTPTGEAVQAHVTTTIEIEGGAKPACVAESVLRYVP